VRQNVVRKHAEAAADILGSEDMAKPAARILHHDLITVVFFGRFVPIFGGYIGQLLVSLHAAHALAGRTAWAARLGQRHGVVLRRLRKPPSVFQFAAMHDSWTSRKTVAARVNPLRSNQTLLVALLHPNERAENRRTRQAYQTHNSILRRRP